MTIEKTDGAIICTGEHIQLFRLLSLEGALKLETKGCRFRGRPVSVVVRKLIGSTTRDKTKLLDELKAYRLKQFPPPTPPGDPA
jgi:hypothetical protein